MKKHKKLLCDKVPSMFDKMIAILIKKWHKMDKSYQGTQTYMKLTFLHTTVFSITKVSVGWVRVLTISLFSVILHYQLQNHKALTLSLASASVHQTQLMELVVGSFLLLCLRAASLAWLHHAIQQVGAGLSGTVPVT